MREAYSANDFEDFGEVVALRDWKQPDGLRPRQMQRIAEQALDLLAGYYVHLPVKQRLYGVEPIARLRVLRDRLDGREVVTDEQFHTELTAIFTSLRDSHTIYILPAPYRRLIAYLPFMVERVGDGEVRRYLVTKIYTPIAGDAFEGDPASPIDVTHWNGMPIERAIALNGELNAGGNADARFARGLKRLTFRWLGLGSRPAEDWVTLTYTRDDREYHARCPWLLIPRREEPLARLRTLRRRREPVATARGLDTEGEWLRSIQRKLFAPAQQSTKWTYYDEATSELIAYRSLGVYGYLRVFSFSLERVTMTEFEAAAQHFVRQPVAGLIIDVRGNPGGDLRAAELLLELLADRPVPATTLEFLNTSPALAMARRFVARTEADPVAEAWGADMRRALAAGSVYVRSPSVPRPALDGTAHGTPKVLLIDALSYSAADAFAAGFQDCELGRVLGTARRTGGGGGNVWEYDVVREYVADALAPLSAGASFDVAVRRMVRGGALAGVGLEDIGVEINAQQPVALTMDDVLGDNERLLQHAIAALEDQQSAADYTGRATE